MNNKIIVPSDGYSRRRDVKRFLLKENPYCYYCGKKCIDYGKLRDGAKNPHDMATIDHLKSKYFRKPGELVQKVLSCYECNQKRAIEENMIYGKEHMQKFST